jgi:hypothetical protein
MQSLMDNNQKTQYEPPVMAVVEMKSEGVVCVSPGTEASRGGYESGGSWPSDE